MQKSVSAEPKVRHPSEFRQEDWGDKIFDIVVWLLVAIAVVLCVYPFLYVLSVSLSDGAAVNRGDVWLLPVGLDLHAFKMVLGYKELWTSYGNTVLYTVLGTLCNVGFSILAAYPLSRRQFFLRKKLNFLLAFTMYFSGGLIPTYMVVTGLGLYNSRWAMILPVLISAYNVMILRSAFEAIPEELFENANLEGANDFVMMSRIAVPLAKPTLAVLCPVLRRGALQRLFHRAFVPGQKQAAPADAFPAQNFAERLAGNFAAVRRLDGGQCRRAVHHAGAVCLHRAGSHPHHVRMPPCTEVSGQGHHARRRQGMTAAQKFGTMGVAPYTQKG